jgi:Ferritin-like domain
VTDSPRSRVFSRETFLTTAAGGGAVLVVGGVAGAGLLLGQDSPNAGGTSPLALALVLERVQAAFYADALANDSLNGELRDFAATAQGHEAEHTDLLVPLVTGGATDPSTYDFGEATKDADSFAAAAATLEDLAVSAYNGLLPVLKGRSLAIASRIVSVDARHAAWVRAIMGTDPAAGATDPGLTTAEVVKALAATGFIKELAP